MFIKTDATIQASILNMLCHVLQLKVNYCLLDAKGIFIGLIMKLIESIEMGNIRDSNIVTPKIITFLFHLARQRENPQMTIPKIINITDNLLANSITSNGSIEALCQLAYEIYFPPKFDEADNVNKSSDKEIYTQKEVVFSMLLKFIDATIVKKTICVILIKDARNLGEINREISESLINLFENKKPMIHNIEDYWCLRKITERIQGTFIADPANMTRLKTRFLLHRGMNFLDDLAIKTIMLSSVPEVVQIFYETSQNHISSHPFQFADYIYQCLNHFITFNYSDNNIFTEVTVERTLQFLQIFTDFLHTLAKAWILNCANQTSGSDRTIFNENLMANIFDFIGKLLVLQVPMSIELAERLSIARLQLIKEMFSFVSVFCGKEVLYNSLKAQQLDYTNNKYTQFIQRMILDILSGTLETTDEINFVLSQHFDQMLSIDRNFIVNASNDPTNLDTILNNLLEISIANTSNKELIWTSLDAIENADIETYGTSLKYLAKQIFDKNSLNYEQSSMIRRAYSVLNEKLQKLAPSDDEDNPQMEVYENVVSETFVAALREYQRYQWHEQYAIVYKSIESIVNVQESKETSKERSIVISKDVVPNEEWFLKQVQDSIATKCHNQSICQLLMEVKSEAKLRKIFDSSNMSIDDNLLNSLIECSFRSMRTRFMQDCFHHNAHINYLKISPTLRFALNVLSDKIENILPEMSTIEVVDIYQTQPSTVSDNGIFKVIETFLQHIIDLFDECLMYVDAVSIQKFFIDHFFGSISFDRLVRSSFVCIDFIKKQMGQQCKGRNVDIVLCACDCIVRIIRVHAIFNQSESYYVGDKCSKFFEAIIDVSYQLVFDHLADKQLIQRNALTTIMEQQNRMEKLSEDIEMRYAKAIFLGKFIEQYSEDCDNGTNFDRTQSMQGQRAMIISLTIAALRSDSFYFFGITPNEIVQSFDWQLHTESNNRLNRLPCIPIDCLNEADVIERFVRRINIIGFPSRQYYEEIFMSLLLLMNQENDAFIVDKQEEYQIKNICLMAIIELLLSCNMYPVVGDRLNSTFHHVPRFPSPKSNTIGMKKLHNIQCMFLHQPNVFYMPNAERCLTINSIYDCSKHINTSIGTHDFRMHQCDLNVVWHMIEGQSATLKSMKIELKNMKHFLEKSAIDYNSGIQLTFDVIALSLEEGVTRPNDYLVNYIQLLPHITKFCELCTSRDQFHWIKNTMIKLQEVVPMDNALSHKYIVYCLCKSYAVLIPSLHDLQQLCLMINNYLKSSHLFVRVAALNGLLILFESCIKTNTTIGGLSEEVLHLRAVTINYITKHISNDENISLYSLEHSLLVWTLNFYLIETTSRYITDCNLIANTIIAANSVLRKTSNVILYACVIHGLERVVLTKTMTKFCHDKVERLALDLVKMENEQLSLLALKLLTTCMYMGSTDQLENTERCNGIIQDEPDVIVQSTEKIEILFNRIKLATRPAAEVYGNILAQLIHDLIPPRDLLTKVIQELLTTSQPHCTIIAKILYQIFRSAIDSSYLPLLQDWLLCSLPNFTAFPIEKTMWYLTIIFVSASINLELIKVFPLILAEYESICDNVSLKKLRRQSLTTQPSSYDSAMLQCFLAQNDSNPDRLYILFVIAFRDFYNKLNTSQKSTFLCTFEKFNEPSITEMLSAL